MKKTTKITIKSYSGFFCRPGYEDKLVLSLDRISYSLTYNDSPLMVPDEKKPENEKWIHRHSISEKVLVEAIFEFASKNDFFVGDMGILDGEGISLIIEYDDKTKQEVSADYGDYIDSEYKNLFKLLQLISFLIPKDKYRPDYFNNKCPY